MTGTGGERSSSAGDDAARVWAALASARGYVVYRACIDFASEVHARVDFVSPSILEVLGVSPDAPFEEWFVGIHPEDAPRTIAANERSAHERVPFDEVFRVWHSGRKEWRWIHAVSRPESGDGDQVYFSGMFIDVTAQKAAELEREQLAAELARSRRLESLGRLAAGVAHDFNNLLTAMSACVELGARQSDPSQLFDELGGLIQQAASMTRELLDFAQPTPRAVNRFDLRSVLLASTSAVERARPGATLRFATAGPLELEGDAQQIGRVVTNLLLNACDASEEDEPVDIQAVGAGDAILLEIADQGAGIDAVTRSQIFEPFFTTKGAKGTGLGLAVVARIVEAHGGTIECESEPAKGSVFRVRLPRTAPR